MRADMLTTCQYIDVLQENEMTFIRLKGHLDSIYFV